MATTKCRRDSEEEALFRSYPYALYFVHSPSTVSHANSGELRNNNESAFHSPLRSETSMNNPITSTGQEVSQFALSRYSSRGSNNSFLHEKKMVYDLQSHGNGTENGETRPVFEKDEIGEDEEDEDEEGEEELFGRKGVWLRYFSFGYSSSFAWMFLQISWRFMVSFGVALLVFYLATKPPPPKMSIKMAGIRQFELGEGLDASGVTTEILTCNCSMKLVVDNKSKVFGLHIHSPVMAISFGHLAFAISTGPELYAGSDTSTSFQLSVGTKNKPMYGAGRSMQDLLESGKGLPLVIHVSLRSRFRMVWKLINPRFEHQAQCFLVLSQAYDKKHRTQAYNSSCIITS